MKKQLFKTLLCITIIPAFFSCASSKNMKKAENDDYSDTISTFTVAEAESETEIADNEEETDNRITEETLKAQTKKKGYFDDLFKYGNKGEYASLGETSIFTRSITGSITQKKNIALVNIENATAGYGSNYLSNYYIIQMNKDSRQKLREAYDKYLKDFENKKLNRKGKNTYKTYGSMEIRADWGTLSNSTPNYGNANAYLGYTFVKNSPYFTIHSFPMENKFYDPNTDAVAKESLNLTYYFTKAQMKELLDMITEENVAEVCGALTTDKTIKKVESDEY